MSAQLKRQALIHWRSGDVVGEFVLNYYPDEDVAARVTHELNGIRFKYKLIHPVKCTALVSMRTDRCK